MIDVKKKKKKLNTFFDFFNYINDFHYKYLIEYMIL